ncbi:MAG: hypothetical protein ACT4PW_01935 [Acidimicrobiia bacterium]
MTESLWPRRSFLRSAAGVAGLALVGPPLLGACTDGGGSGALGLPADRDDSTAARSDRDRDSRSSDEDRSDLSDVSGAVVVWRLSSRRQHACVACKAHAAHRYYADADTAEADRAHPGCSCTVREQRAGSGEQVRQLQAVVGSVYDDRWAGAGSN